MENMNDLQMQLPEGFDPLSLDNQICFALYVCSKEIIRKYGPLLDPLGLTYTSYITMLSLWEKDGVTVKELGKRLFLDSGTLTPLLKKMESQGLIKRERSKQDERTVFIYLTEEGRQMKSKCMYVPQQMSCSNILEMNEAGQLIGILHNMMASIQDDNPSVKK